MISVTTPKGPYEIISMDVFESKINGKSRNFLIIVDHFSDYFEIEELSEMTSKMTIILCKKQFSR